MLCWQSLCRCVDFCQSSLNLHLLFFSLQFFSLRMSIIITHLASKQPNLCLFVFLSEDVHNNSTSCEQAIQPYILLVSYFQNWSTECSRMQDLFVAGIDCLCVQWKRRWVGQDAGCRICWYPWNRLSMCRVEETVSGAGCRMQDLTVPGTDGLCAESRREWVGQGAGCRVCWFLG